MINLSELKVVSDSENIQPLNQFKLLSFFEKNINKFSSSKSLELLKTKFQEYNKDPFDKNFMNFPTNSCISGAVFKSKELFFSNNASKETKFVEEIDN